MTSPSRSPCKRRKAGQGTQRGAVSPFMFGLIIGMSIFSILSLQWARQELIRQQERNAARDKAQAQDIAKAVQFSILAETPESYHEQLDLKRAMAYTTTATAKTRGGETVMVAVREGDPDANFGAGNQRVGITASDDILRRSQVNRAATAAELNQIAGQSDTTVATVDTSVARNRQMQTSIRNLEGLAEQVYAFYAGNMRFPTAGEFDRIAAQFDYKDAWGRKFDYTLYDNDTAKLEFTTPWSYTYTQKLTLKDDNAEQEKNEPTPPPVSPTTPSATTP